VVCDIERDEAVIGERLRQGERPVLIEAGDLGSRLHRPTIREHGHGLDQRPLRVLEQVHAPLDRGAQGVLPFWHVHRSRAQSVQRSRQTV
jgi:hypothetical protein